MFVEFEFIKEITIKSISGVDNSEVDTDLSTWFQQNHHLMHLGFDEIGIDEEIKNYLDPEKTPHHKSILRSLFFWGFNEWQELYFKKICPNFTDWNDFKTKNKYFFDQFKEEEKAISEPIEAFLKKLNIEPNALQGYIDGPEPSERLQKVYEIVQKHYDHLTKEEKKSSIPLKELFNPLAALCPKYFPFYFHHEIS